MVLACKKSRSKKVDVPNIFSWIKYSTFIELNFFCAYKIEGVKTVIVILFLKYVTSSYIILK